MWGSVLSGCPKQCSLPGTGWGRYFYVAYFIDVETEAQKGPVTCPGSHSILLSHWRLHCVVCILFSFMPCSPGLNLGSAPSRCVTSGKWLNLRICGKSTLGTGNSKCKGPQAGVCFRNQGGQSDWIRRVNQRWSQGGNSRSGEPGGKIVQGLWAIMRTLHFILSEMGAFGAFEQRRDNPT